jgi:hypothetical protein
VKKVVGKYSLEYKSITPALESFRYFLMAVEEAEVAVRICQFKSAAHFRLRRLTSSLVFSAIILWNPIPTPSITASKTAHPIAEFLAALKPPLIASAPPVKNPAMTATRLEINVSQASTNTVQGQKSRTGKTYWHYMDPPSSVYPLQHSRTLRIILPIPRSFPLVLVLVPLSL